MFDGDVRNPDGVVAASASQVRADYGHPSGTHAHKYDDVEDVSTLQVSCNFHNLFHRWLAHDS